MFSRLFNIAAAASAIVLCFVAIAWCVAGTVDPRRQFVSLSNGCHLSIHARVADARVQVFNDPSYGPYGGSAVGMAGDPNGPNVAGIGDVAGIYYRMIRWPDGRSIWTLSLSLAYPLLLAMPLPLIWVIRRFERFRPTEHLPRGRSQRLRRVIRRHCPATERLPRYAGRHPAMRWLRWIIIVLVLIGGCVVTEYVGHRRVVPDGRAATLAEYLAWRPSAGEFAVVDAGGREHVIAYGSPASLMLASGPSAYVFDDTGRLIDWSADIGDDPAFDERWDAQGRGDRVMSREEVVDLAAKLAE